jgi:hypothetical protein
MPAMMSLLLPGGLAESSGFGARAGARFLGWRFTPDMGSV